MIGGSDDIPGLARVSLLVRFNSVAGGIVYLDSKAPPTFRGALFEPVFGARCASESIALETAPSVCIIRAGDRGLDHGGESTSVGCDGARRASDCDPDD